MISCTTCARTRMINARDQCHRHRDRGNKKKKKKRVPAVPCPRCIGRLMSSIVTCAIPENDGKTAIKASRIRRRYYVTVWPSIGMRSEHNITKTIGRKMIDKISTRGPRRPNAAAASLRSPVLCARDKRVSQPFWSVFFYLFFIFISNLVSFHAQRIITSHRRRSRSTRSNIKLNLKVKATTNSLSKAST